MAHECCDLCHGFLVDFLCFPIEPPLSKLIKTKNIPKVSHELAKEFYRIFKSINPLEHYYIVRKLLLSLNELKTPEKYISEECVRGMLKLEALIQLSYKDNIKHIIFILEENNIVIDKQIQLIWIGNCIEYLWMHLENIHNEHTGKAPVSYAGPPVGVTKKEDKAVKIIENYFEEIDILYD
jgi:hypothetical protein